MGIQVYLRKIYTSHIILNEDYNEKHVSLAAKLSLTEVSDIIKNIEKPSKL